MLLNLDHLRSFAAAADTLNFSQAGVRVGRVQSAISAQIKLLEDTTGQTLFTRGRGQAMSLTPAGEKLLTHAHLMLRMNAAALSDLRITREQTVFRVGTTETYALSILPSMIALFADLYPQVELTVACGTSPTLLQAIKQGELDLAIVTEQPEREGRRHICHDKLVWTAGKRLYIDENRPIPLAFMPVGCTYRKRALAALDNSGQSWRMAVNCLSPSGVRAAIDADLAVSAMPTASLNKNSRILSTDVGFPDLGNVSICAYNHPEDTSELTDDFILLASRCLSHKIADQVDAY